MQLARAFGHTVRVAEARDVDAEQLELGRHVRIDEAARIAPCEAIRDDLRGLVARRDQPVARPIDGGCLADGGNRDVRRQTVAVHQEPAARSALEPGGLREFIARANTGGENHDIDNEFFGAFVGVESHGQRVRHGRARGNG